MIQEEKRTTEETSQEMNTETFAPTDETTPEMNEEIAEFSAAANEAFAPIDKISAKEDGKKNNIIVINIPSEPEPEDEELSNIVKLSRIYEFEGETISELDLTGLEDVNYMTMQEVEKAYKRLPQAITIQPETTIEYAMAMAHVLTGLPLEFFKYLSGKDLRRIKSRVVNFFYGAD